MNEKTFFKELAKKFGYTNARIRREYPNSCCFEIALTKGNKNIGIISFKKSNEDIDEKWLPNHSSWICDETSKDGLIKTLAKRCIDGTYDRIYFTIYIDEGIIRHQYCRRISIGKFSCYEDIIANAFNGINIPKNKC